MAEYNRNRSDAGRGAGRDFGRRSPSSSRPSFGRDRDSRPPVRMHSAVCSECGNECEVPFKPSGEKPVFCNNCFKKDGNAPERRSNDRDFSERRPSRDRDRDSDRPTMHEATCDGCGNQCEVPFRPSGDKPVYCSECFGKGSKGGGKDNSQQLMQQFEALNSKLDKILNFLIPAIVVPKATKKDKVVEMEMAVESELDAEEEKVKKPKKAAKKSAKKA